MTKKLEKLEKDMQAGQESAAERAVKKLKWDHGYEFKKKRNEHQFLFNDGIKDRIDAPSSLVAKVTSSNQQDTATLTKAVEKLQEDSKALDFWQKPIRLADCSEYGWDTVKEYETDELVANDNDAKHLEKAEKAAEQKVTKCKRVVQLCDRGRGLSRVQGYASAYSQYPPGASIVSAQQPPNVFQF